MDNNLRRKLNISEWYMPLSIRYIVMVRLPLITAKCNAVYPSSSWMFRRPWRQQDNKKTGTNEHKLRNSHELILKKKKYFVTLNPSLCNLHHSDYSHFSWKMCAYNILSFFPSKNEYLQINLTLREWFVIITCIISYSVYHLRSNVVSSLINY